MKISPLTKTIVGLTAAGAAYVWVQKRRSALSDESQNTAEIHGFVSPGYEPVREAFTENFARRREVGAACCVYHKGEWVVDLWGGVRNKATGEPSELVTKNKQTNLSARAPGQLPSAAALCRQTYSEPHSTFLSCFVRQS